MPRRRRSGCRRSASSARPPTRSAATSPALPDGGNVRRRAEEARHRRCSAPSRSSTAPIRRRRSRALQDAEFVVQLSALEDRPRVRRTCCCRSRRSPRPPARFVNIEGRAAELLRHRESARRGASRLEGAARARQPARAGRASSSTPSSRCARPASAGKDIATLLSNKIVGRVTADRAPRGGIAAHRRRADLLRRPAGAPLAAAAEDHARRGRRRRWMNARTLQKLGVAAGQHGAGQAGRGQALAGGARRPACPTTACASPPRIRRRPALGADVRRRDAREGRRGEAA